MRFKGTFHHSPNTIGACKEHFINYVTRTLVRLELAVGQGDVEEGSSVDWTL
jgi:hypothetical protein